MTRRAARLLAIGALAGLLLLQATPAMAHPLGNFTANTYAGLIVGADATRIDYVLDLAEIPAFQARQRIDVDSDGEVSAAEGARYRDEECAAIADGVALDVAARRVTVRTTAAELSFPPGQGGLVTLRLECALLGDTGSLSGVTSIAYADATQRERIGWREVTAVGDGVTLVGADTPSESVSDRLRSYPQDRLSSPLDQTTAALRVDAAGGTAADPGPETARSPEGVLGVVERLTGALTGFLNRQDLTPGIALAAFGLAFVLGTLHALAPGHGKTVIAAYLVGRRGTVRDALQLGVTVAVTHTLGVFVLGAFLSVGQAVAPDRLYPVLGVASGLLFAAAGVGMLRSALARRHEGHHHHHHDHHHDDHTWSVGRSLVVPGLAGGLVPSPSALLVLLGGIALGRAALAAVLVLAYGLGMSAALVGAGYLLLRARHRLDRRHAWDRLARALPLATASLIVLGGLVLAARSALAV